MPALLLWLACSGDPTPPARSELPELPAAAAERRAPAGRPREPVELALALVGEVRGEIEVCGCPTLPYGGFVRREELLRRERAAGPLLHIDLGEMLLKGQATARAEEPEARAALLLSLSRQVGVDLWIPGPSDLLALGPERLASPDLGLRRAQAVWTTAQGSLLPPLQVLEVAGQQIGVIGLASAPTDPRQKAQVQGLPLMDAARAALASLPEGLELVVAAGSIPREEARQLARELPELGLVLSTRGAEVEAPEAPLRADGRPGALIVETPDRGRYLTVLRLRLGGEAPQPVELSEDPQGWRDLRRARALGRPEERLERALQAEGAGRNLALVEDLPLGEELEPLGAPTELAQSLEGYAQSRMAAAVRAAEQAPATVAYASSSACVSCHPQQFARWTYTDHARAQQSLLLRKSDKKPECVGCHSTGYGEPGGWGGEGRGERQFKAVQCESCHGPLAGHPGDLRVQAAPVREQTCLRCHDRANSPQFNYETYLPRASCQP